MAYVRNFAGVSEDAEQCDELYYWTIYVSIDGYPDATIDAATFRFAFDDQDLDLTPDDSGAITLVFDADPAGTVCTVTHEATGLTKDVDYDEGWEQTGEQWKGSEAELTKPWSVKVVINDRRPKGLRADALAAQHANALPLLALEAPFTIQAGNAGAVNHQSEYEDDGLTIGTRYKFNATAPGVVVNRSKFKVEIEYLQDGDLTLDKDEEEEEVDQQVEKELKIDQPGTSVTITFWLSYDQVFIAGEGTGFGYAMALAARYRDPAGAEGRKWVFASQYDCTNVVLAGLNNNLFVYRAPRTAAAVLPVEQGRFDVTVIADWDRLQTDHGPFDKAVFNNPHPGYGLHMCMVFGLTANHPLLRTKNGQYISVHTIGYARNGVDPPDETLTAPQLENFRNRANNGNPNVQRDFVRVFLNYQCDVGAARLTVFNPIQQVTIPAAFEYANGAVLVQGNFPNEEVHYRSRVNHRGLLEEIIQSYIANAPRCGVASYFINGSASIGWAVGKAWDVGWPGHELYVDYETNFTSPTLHPSLLSKPDFNPGEPPLHNAKVYQFP